MMLDLPLIIIIIIIIIKVDIMLFINIFYSLNLVQIFIHLANQTALVSNFFIQMLKIIK